MRWWQGRGACPRGAALHPYGGLGTLLRYLFVPVFFIFSKNILCKFLAHLDSVWYSFSAKLKNKEKTETGTWH
jgi:hypothetical protein